VIPSAPSLNAAKELTVPLVDELMSRMALPVLGAPTFIVSKAELVGSQCTSGGVGNIGGLPSTRALVERLREEYAVARARLPAPSLATATT
jgi:NAD(P)H-dependent flavin oxidoreductase YrpB (nitropropane dioxygenase family)